jgi:hypothetical protein
VWLVTQEGIGEVARSTRALTHLACSAALPIADEYMWGAEYTFNIDHGYFEALARGQL